jgi:hypothetical protein
VTSEVMSQGITSHPTGIQAPDARVTHSPDVYAKLENPMGELTPDQAQRVERARRARRGIPLRI